MKTRILKSLEVARKYARLLADARNRVIYISPNGNNLEVGSWSPNYIEAVFPTKKSQ